MKNTFLIFALLITIIFSSCKTPNILLTENLQKAAVPMEVKGRQGFRFRQVLSYGEFKTGRVKRGWINSTNLQFVLDFRKAKEKFQFKQFTPDSTASAMVYAVGKFESTSYDFFRGRSNWNFNIGLDYKNTFAGTIVPDQSKENSWEFIVYNPESSFANNGDCGFAKDKLGNEIKIIPVKKLEGQKNWINFANFGFEFQYKNTAIAAVSVLNNGRVWIDPSIPSTLQMVVSSMSSAILLRSNLEQAAQNNALNNPINSPSNHGGPQHHR
jgi:hypothetical protein